jgi:biotin carboxylase
MSEPRLLVLGASIHQIPAIQAARRRGLVVLTADNRPDNPGHALADQAFNVSTTDVQAILELARQQHIQGILAAGTDVALPAVARVAQELQLAGPSPQLVDICCDKLAFRRWQQRNQQPHPTFAPLQPELDKTCPGQGTWVVKPTRSSGSKGVTLIDDPEQLQEAATRASCFSINRQALIERLIPGRQLTCEGIMRHGQIALSWITDRRTATPPWAATQAHLFPALITPDDERSILQRLQTTWTLLGYHDGPFDADLVLAPDGPCLLEVTPRTGGNSLTKLIQAASDFDLPDAAVCAAMGWSLELPTTLPRRHTAVFLLGSKHAGTLRYAPERIEDAQHHVPGLRELHMDLPPGALVQPFINGQQRFGEALAAGLTRELLEETEHHLRAWLQLDVEPLDHG